MSSKDRLGVRGCVRRRYYRPSPRPSPNGAGARPKERSPLPQHKLKIVLIATVVKIAGGLCAEDALHDREFCV